MYARRRAEALGLSRLLEIRAEAVANQDRVAGRGLDSLRGGAVLQVPAVDGLPRRLQVYRLLDTGFGATPEGLLLPFADATAGKETYPSGRYLDVLGPSGEIRVVQGVQGRPVAVGPFVVDFNRAYNPSCAYGAPERFACPVTPKANRMDVRIEAGERGFKLPRSKGPAEPGVPRGSG